MTIIVCPLSRLRETVSQYGARHLVTLVRDEELIGRERAVLLEQRVRLDAHLWLEMDDIAEEIDGMIAPSIEHLESLIGFLERWDRSKPLIVHCYAGISRSTAAAFISACVLSPGLSEDEIARRLRLASPTARPNSRLVSIADASLGRNGRMIRAVNAIGDGLGAYESTPFVIRL
jgi:predicted protein tyrosine phosphatase